MRQLTSFLVVCFVALVVFSGSVFSEAPKLINYQGRLINSLGEPENGTFDLTFSIYDISSDGIAVWSETQSVSVVDGLFNVLLGTNTELNASVFADSIRWLGIAVGADPELPDRSRLVTVPWSFRTNVADSADAVTDGSIDLTDIGQNGATAGQIMKWDGTTWSPASDETSTGGSGDIDGVVAGTGLSGGGTSGTVTLNIANGGVGNTQLGNNAVNSGKIQDGSIQFGDVGQNSAASGQVMKWNGSAWVAANDESGGGGGGWTDDGTIVRLDNSNDKVGIGSDTPAAKLGVEASTGDGIFGGTNDANINRFGVVGAGASGVKGLGVLTKGTGVYGEVVSDSSKAIHGKVLGGEGSYAGYFEGDVRMDGLEMPTGAASGYVLTSDATGVATWQAPSGGGGGSGGWVDDGTNVRLETTGDRVGIGTATPNFKLHVVGSGTDAIVGAGTSTIGVTGVSSDTVGVLGFGSGAGAIGVHGLTLFDSARAIYGQVLGGSGSYAGYFEGDILSTGKATFGPGNTNTGVSAFVAGSGNSASGEGDVVGGGTNNSASGGRSTVSGGWNNVASSWGAVGGGVGNVATGQASAIPGGNGNRAEGANSAILGGLANRAVGDYSAILGGLNDTIEATGSYSFLIGLNSKLTTDSTVMLDMPHIRFGDEATGYEFPTVDGSSGQVLQTDGAGQLSWGAAPGGGGSGWVDDGLFVKQKDSSNWISIGTAEEELNFKVWIDNYPTVYGLFVENDIFTGYRYGNGYRVFTRSSYSTDGEGDIGTFTTYRTDENDPLNQQSLVRLSALAADGKHGFVSVRSDSMTMSGDIFGVTRVGTYVDAGGDGHIDILDHAGHLGINASTSEGAGFIGLWGPNGNQNIVLSSFTGYPNHGYIAARDVNGNQQAALYVDASGQGVMFADVKNFREANPRDPSTDIWYASLEGPEAAAYVRGTATLVNGYVNVSLPDHFSDVTSNQGITVQVTPHDASSLGLAVVERANDHIVVRELANGQGNYAFDYYVMAVRRGYEDYEVIRAKPIDDRPQRKFPAEMSKAAEPASPAVIDR